MTEGLIGKIGASLKEGFRWKETQLEQLVIPLRMEQYTHEVHEDEKRGTMENEGILLSPARDYIKGVRRYYTPSGRLLLGYREELCEIHRCNCGRTYGGYYPSFKEPPLTKVKIRLMRGDGNTFWIPREKRFGTLNIPTRRTGYYTGELGKAYVRYNNHRTRFEISEDMYHTLRREHAAYEKGKKI